MKRSNVFSLVAAGLALSLTACNNSSDSSTGSNDTAANNSPSGAVVSTNNYAARADSVRANVKAGYYLNPRTGKAYTSLNVDTTTGALTDEGGRPVRRYVDNRTWSVYDSGSWDTVGSAQMKNGSMMYRGQSGDWETYDKRWTDDTAGMSMDNNSKMDMNMNGNDGGMMSSDTSMSTSGKGMKVKVSNNGNKVKVKNPTN